MYVGVLPFIFMEKHMFKHNLIVFYFVYSVIRSGQGLQVPESSLQHSANSGDGGDEYTSSEASELDTLGTIPTWIKKELRDSANVTEENDADDSDDEGNTEEHVENDFTLASIKINKDLKLFDGMKILYCKSICFKSLSNSCIKRKV